MVMVIVMVMVMMMVVARSVDVDDFDHVGKPHGYDSAMMDDE